MRGETRFRSLTLAQVGRPPGRWLKDFL